MPPTTVNYVVNITASSQAAQTLTALNTQARMLQQTLGNVNVGGGGGGGRGGFGGTASGFGRGSYEDQAYNMALGRRIIPGLTAALGIHLARETINFGTAAARAASDPNRTEYGENRALKESFPILGGFIKDWLAFIDEASQYAPRVREMHRRTAQVLVQIEAESRRDAGNLRDQNRLYGLESQSFQAGQGLGRLNLYRQRYGGGLRPEQLEHLDPALMRHAQAAGAYDAAQDQANQARIQFDDAMGRQRGATRTREVFERDVEQTRLRGQQGNGKYSQQDEEALLLKQKALTEAIAREKRAIAEAEAASNFAVEKANALHQANLDLSRTEAQIAQQRLQFAQQERNELKGGAISFAGLRPEERRAAVEAARVASRQGFDVLSDEEKGLVHRAGLFDRLIERKSLEAAQKDPAFAEALQIGGLRGFGDIDRDIRGFKNQVERFGELGPAMKDAIDSFKKAMEAIIEDNKAWRQAQMDNAKADQRNKDLQKDAGGGK